MQYGNLFLEKLTLSGSGVFLNWTDISKLLGLLDVSSSSAADDANI